MINCEDTTVVPDTTTTIEPETTTETTTTTSTTSTTSTSTTPEPPKPKEGHYNVTNDDVTCIMLDAAISFTIEYNTQSKVCLVILKNAKFYKC